MIAKTNLEKLSALTTRQELADLLNIKTIFLTNTLYRLRPDTQYVQFTIPKKNGGQRIISSPSASLKDLQRRLANLLYSCQKDIHTKHKINPVLSHGFEKNKSIITNASRHKNKNVILNIDLADFFDSFNFGRVRGFFISNNNFKLHPTIATTIAQIACYNNMLPQGSPSSPIISNLICTILDIKLSKLAKKHGCSYSRYADDLTFSTNKYTFPAQLAINSAEVLEIGETLQKEITRAGFNINPNKTRLTFKTSRQEVTGLTVNKKINIEQSYYKNIRAMAHTLFKDSAFSLMKPNGSISKGTIHQLEGMFGFIDSIDKHNNILASKNRATPLYQPFNHGLDYRAKLNAREKTFSKFLYYKWFHGLSSPLILTEGKTDRVYLKCALNRLKTTYPSLINSTATPGKNPYNLNFFQESSKMQYFLDISGGASDYKKFIERYIKNYSIYQKNPPKHPVILVLDNDSGTTLIVNHLASKVSNCPKNPADIKSASFTHIFHNLYILLTPLLPGQAPSCMEDFFDAATLAVTIDGKTFNKHNDTDSASEYGKHIFSTRVIKANSSTVDFSRFTYIFNNILEIQRHYSALLVTK